MFHRATEIPLVTLHTPHPEDAAENRAAATAVGRALRHWLTPVVILVAGLAAFTVDVPVAYWVVKLKGLAFLNRTLQSAEPFGEGAGVALVIAAIYVLDPKRRRTLPRLAIAALGAGLAVNIVKLGFSRVRPYKLRFDEVTSVWETFAGLFPLLGTGSYYQSFPSAHTATAVALMAVLSALYQRGWWFFPGLAALVALQRVETGAHYLSDVLCGAAVGLLTAQLCLYHGRLAARFDRFEAATEPNALKTQLPRGIGYGEVAPLDAVRLFQKL